MSRRVGSWPGHGARRRVLRSARRRPPARRAGFRQRWQTRACSPARRSRPRASARSTGSALRRGRGGDSETERLERTSTPVFEIAVHPRQEGSHHRCSAPRVQEWRHGWPRSRPPHAVCCVRIPRSLRFFFAGMPFRPAAACRTAKRKSSARGSFRSQSASGHAPCRSVRRPPHAGAPQRDDGAGFCRRHALCQCANVSTDQADRRRRLRHGPTDVMLGRAVPTGLPDEVGAGGRDDAEWCRWPVSR